MFTRNGRTAPSQVSPGKSLSRRSRGGSAWKLRRAASETLERRVLLSLTSPPIGATQNLVSEGTVEVDLRASDLTAGNPTSWTNTGAMGGSFSAVGMPTVAQSTDGGGTGFQAVQFNGLDQAFTTGTTLAPADLTGAAPRSMEVWVLNPTIDGIEETMVAWAQRGGPDGTNESFSYGNTYGVGQWGGGFDSTWAGNAAPGAPGTAPTANVWHYMVFTYNGTVNNVYADGQLLMTHTIGALNTNPADPISIAAQNQSGNPASAIFGKLDIASVRISSGALTASDIANNYAQGVPGQPVASDHAPAAPTNLMASAAGTGIQLSFTDNADNELQFRVLRGPAAGGPFTQIATLPAATGTGSTVTYTDSTAQPGVTYFYEVAAFNAFNGGTSSTSSPVSASIPAPVAGTNYYPFEEGSGTTTADTIGGNNGTLVGAAPPTWVAGQSGQAGDFALNFTGANAPEMQSANTGTNGMVQLQHSLTPVLGGTSTLAAWIKTTQVSATPNHWSSPAITGNEVPGADWDVSWGFLDQSGHIGIAEGDSGPDIAKSATPVNDGQWHFVAFTRNASTGTVQVYVDGALQAQSTGTDAQATQIKTGYFSVLGAQTDVTDASGTAASVAGYVFFNGSLDDVHIYNRVISQTEVQALYAGQQAHPPAAPSNFTATATAGNVTLTWRDNADDEVGFVIDRATSRDGPWTQVTTSGRINGTGGTGTYVDKNLAPGTYYYRIRAFNGFNGGVESANVFSGPVVVPASTANGVELHVYNQAYWAGGVAYSSLLPNVDFVAPSNSPAPPFVHGNENSMIFTGKVRADTTGLYTFVSNTSEDGYLYVNGVLVSEDPGVHGPRDAGSMDTAGNFLGQVFPITLTGGQSYDFVLLESNQSSTPVAHLKWVTPANTTGTPVLIPQDHLTPISDAPSAPTGLAASISVPPDQVTPSHAVDLTFNSADNATVQYQLQRSSDNGTTWQTVGQRDPGGATANADGTITPVALTIEDAMPVPGATYQYRVVAFNYDHTTLSTTPATVTVSVPASPTSPQTGVEAHYFKGTLLGSGNPQLIGTPPAEFALVNNIDKNFDNSTPADSPDGQNFPDIPRIGHTDWSIMYTGKIHTDAAGTYTFITNTDDDGYLWVNDMLVSSDPGGHGQRNATNLVPISLAGNTDYDFIMVQSQGIFGAGAHLLWVEPGQTTPAVVNNFSSAISDTPTAPTGLAAATGSPTLGTGVTLTWTDTSPSETGFTVERATNAGFTQNVSVVGTAGFDTTSFTDTTAQAGTTYFYRLRAFNWDGVSGNSNVASAAASATGTFVGTAGADNWYVREDADHQHVDVYFNTLGTGTPVQVPITGTPGLSFQGLAGNDSLTIDYSNGDPNFASGISFDGGTGNDTLTVVGSNAADSSGLTAAALSRGTNPNAVTFTNTENLSLAVGTYNVSGSQTLGNVTIGGGATLTVAHGGTPNSATLDVQGLTITSGGTLDLNDNSLLLHYTGVSPASTIRQLLVRGYNGGSWNGTGITSSDAQTHVGNALGFADAADGVVTGQAANSVLVKYTRVGDVNLDGTVNFNDLLALAQHYGNTGANWDQGDLNYDGTVNFNDLLALAQNYGQSTSAVVAASSSSLDLLASARKAKLSTRKH